MTRSPWRVVVARRIAKRGVGGTLARVVRNLLEVASPAQVKVLDVLVDPQSTLEQLEAVCGTVPVVAALVAEPEPMGLVEAMVLAMLETEEHALVKARTALPPYDSVEVVRQAVQPLLEAIYYETLS
jgi:hypothetical protein